MRRVAVFAVAAVALALLGLPPVLGMLTESQVTARVAALDESGVLKASLRSYERGWFRSHARIAVGLAPRLIAKLDALGAAGGMPSFAGSLDRNAPVEIEIAHGPLAVLDGVHFGWSKIVARFDPRSSAVVALDQSLGVPYLFEFRGRTNFGGDVVFDAVMPAVDLTIAGARVEFSGAALAGTFAGRHLVSNGQFERFELTSQPGAFALRNVRAATDTELRAGIAPGDTSLSIERISIVDAERGAEPVFGAENLRVASKVGLDPSETLLNMHATYDVDSAFIDGTHLKDASVGVAVDKLDVAALEAYLEAAQAETVGVAPGADLKPALGRALAAGPSLVLDPVRFSVNEEPFTARLEVAANPTALPAAGTFDPEDPATLLPALRSAAKVEVSKKLARDIVVLASQMRLGDNSLAPEQRRQLAEAQAGLILVTLVSQGILVDAGDTYRVEMRLADGALTLNGTPLPFGLP